jgi:hypothetical protein
MRLGEQRAERSASPLAGLTPDLAAAGTAGRELCHEAYAELLTARCGDMFNPEQDAWRLEFELNREGVKGFRLYAPPEEEDSDEEVEAEVSAEELQHIGTLPRFFARMGELFLHLTRHWPRLVEESDDANRARWPMNSTWQ